MTSPGVKGIRSKYYINKSINYEIIRNMVMEISPHLMVGWCFMYVCKYQSPIPILLKIYFNTSVCTPQLPTMRSHQQARCWRWSQILFQRFFRLWWFRYAAPIRLKYVKWSKKNVTDNENGHLYFYNAYLSVSHTLAQLRLDLNNNWNGRHDNQLKTMILDPGYWILLVH